MTDGEVRYKTTGVADENTMPGLDVIRRLTYVGFSMFDRYVPSLLSILYGGKTAEEAIAEAREGHELNPKSGKRAGLTRQSEGDGRRPSPFLSLY